MALSQRSLRTLCLVPGAWCLVPGAWCLVHKWTGLVATLFLLLLCLTGLPLIFHVEIDALTHRHHIAAGDTPAVDVSFSRMMIDTLQGKDAHVPMYLTWDYVPDSTVVYASVASALDAPDDQLHSIPVDATRGPRLAAAPEEGGVLAFLFDLHANLLLGLIGQMLLGLVGLSSNRLKTQLFAALDWSRNQIAAWPFPIRDFLKPAAGCKWRKSMASDYTRRGSARPIRALLPLWQTVSTANR